jgi:hypothetical protein
MFNQYLTDLFHIFMALKQCKLLHTSTLLKRIKGALEFCAASNIQRKPDYNIYCAYEEDL